jgi:peptidoglycan/LPS O-acetylase OafA/YrhL
MHNVPAAAVSGSSQWLATLWPQMPSFREALWQGSYGILAGKASPGVFNNVLWTMNLEFFGSFLVYAFAALFGQARQRWLAYGVGVLLFWNGYYLAFIFGMILCDIGVAFPKFKLHPLVGLLAGMNGLLLGARPIPSSTHLVYSDWKIPFLPSADMFVLPHVIGAGLVLLAVVYSPLLRRTFATKPLRYLGKISFSMYLIHVLIIGSIGSAALSYWSPHHSYLVAMVGATVLSAPVIVLVAHYFNRFIDAPAVRISNKLNRGWLSIRSL